MRRNEKTIHALHSRGPTLGKMQISHIDVDVHMDVDAAVVGCYGMASRPANDKYQLLRTVIPCTVVVWVCVGEDTLKGGKVVTM